MASGKAKVTIAPPLDTDDLTVLISLLKGETLTPAEKRHYIHGTDITQRLERALSELESAK